MPFGLRLTSTKRDRAGLLALIERAPAALMADWLVLTSQDDEAVYAVSDAVGRDDATALARQGHDVVGVDDVAVTTLRDGVSRSIADLRPRRAHGLLTALAPVPAPLTGVPAEAVFLVEDEGATARLFERLVLLDRADAHVCEVDVDGVSRLLVRVPSPPLWLVMKHAEESVGVRPFVRDASSPALLVEVGSAHPLADRLAAALQQRGEVGLLRGDGRLLRTRAPWPERPMTDALRPELPPTTTVLTPTPLRRTFTVRLRLGDDPAAHDPEPELFFLDEEAMTRLEDWVDGAPPEELQRLLLSRLADESGRARYVLREIVRLGVSRLGLRLQTLLSRRGFARVAGHEGLFLPPGKRLQPTLRRDDVRALLHLDDAAAVVVDEDADGLVIMRLAQLEDQPIGALLTWLASERRVELDRMLEDAVLTFPGLRLTRPREEARERLRAAERPVARPRAHWEREVRPRPASSATTTTRPGEEHALAALRTQEATLQARVLAAPEDADAWQELSRTKAALGDMDDGVICASVASFLRPGADLTALDAAAVAAGDLLELVTQESPSHATAVRLCALLLRGIERGDLDDGVAQHATVVVAREDFPVTRRLQWVVLRALHGRTKDAIGLTRAKEQVIGALNARGLTESLDLPRFVRAAIALGDDGERRVAARGEQVALLERLLLRVVPKPFRPSDARNALLKAIFAHGIGRLGGDVRRLVAAIEEERPMHEGPLRILLRLYVARLQFVVSGASAGADDAWREEVKRAVASEEQIEHRRVAEWLVKRSLWLRPDPPVEPQVRLRPALEQEVSFAEHHGRATLVDATTKCAQRVSECYDYEITAAVERLLAAALRSGEDDTIANCARVAHGVAGGLRILAHRARLLGAVMSAAASTGTVDLVNACLNDVAAIAADKNVPSARDLLLAVQPALLALRRLGEVEAARRFLGAFEPLTRTTERETAPLAAAVAEGYHQIADVDAAEELLERALARVLAGSTPHVDRYEAGAAVAGALRRWPSAARAARCEALLVNLRVFHDSFTTSAWFPTHQVLMAERLIECLIDDVTVRTDRLQAWLDADEARVRRRILADWRSAVDG